MKNIIKFDVAKNIANIQDYLQYDFDEELPLDNHFSIKIQDIMFRTGDSNFVFYEKYKLIKRTSFFPLTFGSDYKRRMESKFSNYPYYLELSNYIRKGLGTAFDITLLQKIISHYNLDLEGYNIFHGHKPASDNRLKQLTKIGINFSFGGSDIYSIGQYYAMFLRFGQSKGINLNQEQEYIIRHFK